MLVSSRTLARAGNGNVSHVGEGGPRAGSLWEVNNDAAIIINEDDDDSGVRSRACQSAGEEGEAPVILVTGVCKLCSQQVWNTELRWESYTPEGEYEGYVHKACHDQLHKKKDVIVID